MRHIFLLLTIIPLLSFSHSGRTDSRGGHNDNINGGYHYHHGCSAHSHSGGCPYEYENCRNGGSRSSYKTKSNKYTLWYIIGGFVLFIFILYLYGVYSDYRVKQRKLKEERLEKDKRHKTFLYLKRKQFNQNDEYISNQLTAEENVQYNELKEEFTPKSKVDLIKKTNKPKSSYNPYIDLGKVLISFSLFFVILYIPLKFMASDTHDHKINGIESKKKENSKESSLPVSSKIGKLKADFNIKVSSKTLTFSKGLVKDFTLNQYLKINIVLTQKGILYKETEEYYSNIKNFEPPTFEGFEIVKGPEIEVNHSWENSIRNFRVNYTYILKPKNKGEIIISEAKISFAGKNFKTLPVVIQVN